MPCHQPQKYKATAIQEEKTEEVNKPCYHDRNREFMISTTRRTPKSSTSSNPLENCACIATATRPSEKLLIRLEKGYTGRGAKFKWISLNSDRHTLIEIYTTGRGPNPLIDWLIGLQLIVWLIEIRIDSSNVRSFDVAAVLCQIPSTTDFLKHLRIRMTCTKISLNINQHKIYKK